MGSARLGSSRRGAFVAVVAVLAVLATSAALPASHAAPGAGGSTTWVQLSSGSGITNIVDPDVQRFGKTLQVVWTQESGTSAVLRTRIIGADGSPASTVHDVLAAWGSLDEFPAIITTGGQRMIVFSGIRTTDTSDPYSAGAMYVATSSDGLTWTLGTGSMSHSTSAYASYGSDAVDAAGTPVAVFTPGTSNDISFHVGVSAANPATEPDATTTHNAKCCAYYAGAAYDKPSGQAWTAWYSNSGDPSTDGVDAQRVYPSLGTFFHAPKSTVASNGSASSIAPIQRVQVASRTGSAGGLWTAYPIGYPSPTKIALWRLGTSSPLVMATAKTVSQIGVAPGPGGRMWLFWWESYSSRLHAVRTNPGVTRFGRVCTIGTPHATTDIWKTAGDGSLGRLDLVVNAGSGSAEQISSTRVKPCLSGSVSPTSVKSSTGGSVTVHVADAGTAVAGATVKYGTRTKTTDNHGNATFSIAKGTSTGRHSISFSAPGYTGGKVTFRVT